MQARLMFAAATAIKPDILIVDEMLGAGDAYFVAKSKTRVENMISGGCTMLLVSHSMQQVLELCDRVMWLEHGAIRMQGDPLEVVKAYEQAQHGRVSAQKILQTKPAKETSEETGTDDQPPVAGMAAAEPIPRTLDQIGALRMQEPTFIPQSDEPVFPEVAETDLHEFRHIARGGITRWDGEVGVKLTGFSIITQEGIANRLRTLQPVKFAMALTAERSDAFRCRYGLVFNDIMGNTITTIWSPPDRFSLAEDETKIVEMVLNPLQIGPGNYTIGISVLEETPIELLNMARRFDLLGRSFCCEVAMDESLSAVNAGFVHTGEWKF
jgi:lipopolysaccharide transport system ATP-binding protein